MQHVHMLFFLNFNHLLMFFTKSNQEVNKPVFHSQSHLNLCLSEYSFALPAKLSQIFDGFHTVLICSSASVSKSCASHTHTDRAHSRQFQLKPNPQSLLQGIIVSLIYTVRIYSLQFSMDFYTLFPSQFSQISAVFFTKHNDAKF